jgi:hypothetical protein
MHAGNQGGGPLGRCMIFLVNKPRYEVEAKVDNHVAGQDMADR